MENHSHEQPFSPEDEFLRRISPEHWDPKTGKVSSAAFTNTSNTNRMSVNWRKYSSLKDTLRGFPTFGVASITAELSYSLNQQIDFTPVQGVEGMPDNPAHCDIVGDKNRRTRQQFRDKATYLKYPNTTGATPPPATLSQ